MCAIIGCIIAGLGSAAQANSVLGTIFERSVERGRDGAGLRIAVANEEPVERRFLDRSETWNGGSAFFKSTAVTGSLIANMRAEPTTEYVEDKHWQDQQPYTLNKWSIVHNGTIANDAKLRTSELDTPIDSAAIVELLASLDFDASPDRQFLCAVQNLKGSYAILATHADLPGVIFAACNYRPIWLGSDFGGIYFASSRDYFPDSMSVDMLSPYSVWMVDDVNMIRLDQPTEYRGRALVVCSGGLDSVVAATAMVCEGLHVELVHFRYGSRAEGPEIAAIHAVAAHLGVKLHIVPMGIYDKSDSPLLQADSAIAGGEAGAEFAHEWVPARNLVMLSLATAYAEAKGFDTIVLGNNLEEAGAYPDNEPEFIARFNDLLPFAVGDGKKMRVLMPVGNLMKHEIVALGHELGAPLHLTWSCYRNGPTHCGKCGPCYMRRKAFEINHIPEVIQYASEGK
jgi:7-cyano-7-deazaguanine synthase